MLDVVVEYISEGRQENWHVAPLPDSTRERQCILSAATMKAARLKRLKKQWELEKKSEVNKVPIDYVFPDVIVYSSQESSGEESSEEKDESSEEDIDTADGSESGLSHDSTSSSEGDGEPRPKISEDFDEDDYRAAAGKRRRHRRRKRKALAIEEEKKDFCQRIIGSLRNFYNETGGITTWKMTHGWDRNTDQLHKWSGIGIGTGNDSYRSTHSLPHIKEIVLPSNGIGGPWRRPFRTLLPLICNTLTTLRLSGNKLSGNIPRCIGTCKELTILSLNDNEITGELPLCLNQLTKLRVLNLRQNNIEGFASIAFMLKSLVSLNLSENNFSGALNLADLCNMEHLEDLDLSYNSFAGSFFTPSVCKALEARIVRIRLSRNDFNGIIPDDIRQCVNLTSLTLDGNRFSGPIPDGLCALTSLQRLWLADNHFQGNLPEKIGRLRNLRTFDIGGNSFGPSVPASIGKLRKLSVLRFDRNSFVGFLPFDEIKKMSLLEEMSYVGNEYLDPHMLETLKEFALENNIHLDRRDNWDQFYPDPCDPASESEDDEGGQTKKDHASMKKKKNLLQSETGSGDDEADGIDESDDEGDESTGEESSEESSTSSTNNETSSESTSGN